MPPQISSRDLKNQLFGQVARIGKVVAHPKRLELIELLSQGEKDVEQLASATDISVKLTSAHLKELRQARVVVARRAGKHQVYRLTSESVADLWVTLRVLAEQQLPDLQAVLQQRPGNQDDTTDMDGPTVWRRAQQGTIALLDVRPASEFVAAHLPHAYSIPLSELPQRAHELPRNLPVVTYCRGPFCLMAQEGVEVLRTAGFAARRLELGVAEWRAAGLPLSR
jgi:rhodanese-related sulfurtransferase/DNA-binding transcriptional ArsR family regulator